MPWEIEIHIEVKIWMSRLASKDLKNLRNALNQLEINGPTLGRPLVDSIKNSEISNLKELRPLGSNLRVLFVFNKKRNAVLLVGGDKTNIWSKWYRKNIPIAIGRYYDYLKESEGWE